MVYSTSSGIFALEFRTLDVCESKSFELVVVCTYFVSLLDVWCGGAKSGSKIRQIGASEKEA